MAIQTVIALSGGRVGVVQMPNLPAILMTVGRVPSQHMLDLLNLLVADGDYTPQGAGERKFIEKANQVKGWYAVAALCLVEPKLVLPPAAPNAEAGEIGPDDLTWGDLEALYHGFFRWGNAPAPGSGWLTSTEEPGRPAGDLSAGDALPPAAGDADGANRPHSSGSGGSPGDVGGGEPDEGRPGRRPGKAPRGRAAKA